MPASPDSPAPNGQARRRARTRSALLTAACELLAERRTNASIEEITKRAGVGFGTFYNHFATREDLFSAAVMEVLDTYSTWLRSATARLDDPAEIFSASFRLTGRLASQTPGMLAPLLAQGTEVLLVERGLRVHAIEDMARGVEAGRFVPDDPEVLLMAVGGALLGLVRLINADPGRDHVADTDAMARRTLMLLGLNAQEAAGVVARDLPEPVALEEILSDARID